MKRVLLFAFMMICLCTVRSQNVANTWWMAYDSTNTPDLYWHFDSDTCWFSLNGVDYDSVSTFTENAGQFFITDIPYPAPGYCPGIGTYNKVFNGDTLWLPVVNDTCPTRDDYLATHYYINIMSTIDEPAYRGMRIFPNPTNGTVHLVANQYAEQYIVTDISGRVIEEQTFTTNATINLTSEPAGIYFVSVRFVDGKTMTQKIVRE